MDEQRRQILQMLAEGTITADEAERLIDAVEREQSEPSPGTVPSRKAQDRPRYLRVLVEDSPGSDEASRINVRVPLQLLRAGVKLTSLIPARSLERINTELDKNGVPVDLTRLKPEDLEELIEQIDDVTINVDDHESKIQVFCE